MDLPGRRFHLGWLLGSILLILVALIEGNTLIAAGWGVVAVLYFGAWWSRTHSQPGDDSLR